MSYDKIVKGIMDGLIKMKSPDIATEEFYRRLNRFKNFDYKKLSDDEIFWMLTYVLFFNMGKKASMIEKKLPLLKENLYGVGKLSHLDFAQIEDIIYRTGFPKQIRWCVYNSKVFYSLLKKYGTFSSYLAEAFNIRDTLCSNDQLRKLYIDIKSKFVGIGETAGWHFLTELGFFTLKPDKVIRRIFYRIGLIEDESDLDASIAVGREMSKQLNIPIRYIDIIFVKYGQVGQSDLLGTVDGICTENNPKCNICELKSICRYYRKAPETKYVNNININSSRPNITPNNTRTFVESSNEFQANNPRHFEAEKFQAKYLQLNEAKKLLLLTLIKKCGQFCPEHFATNTPDYRFKNKVNFCLITLLIKEQKIRIHIRTDGLRLSSSVLQIKELPNHNYSGDEWVEIIVDDNLQVDEAVRLIKETYDYHLQKKNV
ncbi:MAG TPA: hypothetical protein PLH43_03295 [Acetivibrio sp.]|uniref:hypothetical protein n=1 Tax=Acetivibrio sp. TaxID=1872092 RepID=UPI002C5B8C96|nr:hypothetical protein [Acetivibrio sp.]HOM01839.1 hypothetical protein [Acetivibrio sp.]